MSDTKDYIILKLLDNVRTRLEFWKYDKLDHTWTRKDNGNDDNESNGGIPVGEDVTVQSTNRDTSVDNALWVMRDGYLVPDTLELGSAEDGCANTHVIKSKPAMFDATKLSVQQYFATSKDGCRIPYFVIGNTNLIPDGSNPVLLDAYGGFEISMTPGYSAGVGAGWLERGGVKVIANIRGGGEYGPAWHQAALKEKRYKCYEDVEAVAQNLIHVRKLTCPAKLACIGGSNGGLLVGNLLTRPVSSTLFGAAVCQVPLLDMKRYSHLLAGASWMGEYGNPDIVDEWTYLRRHSPYHLLRHDILGMPEEESPPPPPLSSDITNDSNWKCPRTLFTTSTCDDRVHPGHARKMVASLLEEAGVEKAPKVLYWENTEGGHGGAADNEQRAFMWALTYNFLARELGLD
jgi:prolyl oligopeptidase